MEPKANGFRWLRCPRIVAVEHVHSNSRAIAERLPKEGFGPALDLGYSFVVLTRRCENAVVRTTLTIDDDMLRAARKFAAAENMSIGKALSEIARRGLAARSPSNARPRFPVFHVSPGTPLLTLEMINSALDGE